MSFGLWLFITKITLQLKLVFSKFNNFQYNGIKYDKRHGLFKQIKIHETSDTHRLCRDRKFQSKNNLNAVEEAELKRLTSEWTEALERIANVLLTAACCDMAHRGTLSLIVL